jgi:hypothetical protein
LVVVEGQMDAKEATNESSWLVGGGGGQMEAEGTTNESRRLVGGGGRADGGQGSHQRVVLTRWWGWRADGGWGNHRRVVTRWWWWKGRWMLFVIAGSSRISSARYSSTATKYTWTESRLDVELGCWRRWEIPGAPAPTRWAYYPSLVDDEHDQQGTEDQLGQMGIETSIQESAVVMRALFDGCWSGAWNDVEKWKWK